MNKVNFQIIHWLILIPFFLAGCKTSPLHQHTESSDTLKITSKSSSSLTHPYQASQTRKHDLLHTKLEVEFDWEKHYLYGTATLTLTPYFYPQNTVTLDAKGFDIEYVKLLKKDSMIALKYDYDRRKLLIYLDSTYQRTQKYVVEISYTAKPDELPTGGSQAITEDKGLYFINSDEKIPDKPRQIWTQGETEASSCWFPTIDSPHEKTTQEMYITVDKEFQTLSNGELIYSKVNEDDTRTDYWKMNQPHAPYLFMMVVGQYRIVKEEWNDKEISYYVEPDYEEFAKDIFGDTPEMLSFFSEKLQYPYPWNKYAQVVVRDFVSGAMENTTASVFMEDVQVDRKSLQDFQWEDIIAHELFHQWFGDLVTCESWANLPLNEAFANYAEYLWAEHKHGKQEADLIWQKAWYEYLEESKEKKEPLIRYHYVDKEDMFDAHSYEKGGMVLHMLRNYVGEEAFWEALHLYLKKHAYQTVEIHHLRLAFEQVTGEDLNWFFNQWFLRPGHPTLSVKHTYKDKKLCLEVTQKQDTLFSNVYRLPLKVAIWTDQKPQYHTILIDQTHQVIELEIDTLPKAVLLDANSQLAGEIQHAKTKEELIYQYYHAPQYLARHEVLSNLSMLSDDIVRKLYVDALDDPFWAIRQMAIEAFTEYQGKDKAEIQQKIKEIAIHDPKSLVRAIAINTLSLADNSEDFAPLFLETMKDSSYAVLTSSLLAYWQSTPLEETVLEVMEKYENEKSNDVRSIITEYYLNTFNEGKFEWVLQQIAKSRNFFEYELVHSFGAYLLEMSPVQQQKGIKVLATLIRKKNTEWIKFSAFQALVVLEQLEGVPALLQKLKKQETNLNLKKMYEMLYED